MPKEAKMTIRMPLETQADLRKASDAIGISVADLIRLAIAGLLAHGYVESPLSAKLPNKLRRIK